MNNAKGIKMLRNSIRLRLLSGVLGIALLPNSPADTANLNLKLTVTVSPQSECTINGGDSMSVTFGQVQEALIDGVNYKKIPITYNLSCKNTPSNTVTMSLSWNQVTFNGLSAVKTNLNNFGIAIYKDSTRLNNNTTLNFNLTGASPELYAVPDKPTGSVLSDVGEFYGAITMTLSFL